MSSEDFRSTRSTAPVSYTHLEECAVMRRGDEVAHVYVDICFGTLPEEGGRIGHSDSEPEAVVEQYEIGRILAAFLHHLRCV